MTEPLARRLLAEGMGSAMLFASVIGSGIMAERLSAGNSGLALLANSLATGAMLFVLIAMLGPISGAHFNPAVTLVATCRRESSRRDAALYVLCQLACGIAGVWIAHLMFGAPVFQISTHARSGIGQWTGEAVATFGLTVTILGTARHRPALMPATVACYITAAYWFTSSTSFANPAITIARSLSESFSGIAPRDVPMFVLAQIAGALAGLAAARLLFPAARHDASDRAFSPDLAQGTD